MSVYFTSDLHLSHKLASELRGFNSIQEHDDFVMDSLKKIDNKRAMIWILGDVAMQPEALERLGDLRSRLKLVRGNHDQYKDEEYQKYFEVMHGFLKYKNLWLSHCPIHPQEMFRCGANVHGHIHKNAATDCLGFPYINMNWDFWRRPVSLNEISFMVQNEMSEKEFIALDKDGGGL